MGSPRRGPVPPDGQGPENPVACFAAQLRELRAQAGSPSFRQLAKITHYSPSALAQATGGKRLPSEPVVRAFAAACGADPDQWARQLKQIVELKGARAIPISPPEQANVPVPVRNRRHLVAIASGSCALLAAGMFLGTKLYSPSSAEQPHRAPVANPVRRAIDGTDPIVGGCVKDAHLINTSPVIISNQTIGALELIYSTSCAAGWARIYLYSGEPKMLGEVTVSAPDGRLAAFAYPLVKQLPVYTDVLTPGPGGCLAASAIFHLPHRAPLKAVITCQNPAPRHQPPTS